MQACRPTTRPCLVLHIHTYTAISARARLTCSEEQEDKEPTLRKGRKTDDLDNEQDVYHLPNTPTPPRSHPYALCTPLASTAHPPHPHDVLPPPPRLLPLPPHIRIYPRAWARRCRRINHWNTTKPGRRRTDIPMECPARAMSLASSCQES